MSESFDVQVNGTADLLYLPVSDLLTSVTLLQVYSVLCLIGDSESSSIFGLSVTMEAPPVTMMPVTGGTINMMEYLLQGK